MSIDKEKLLIEIFGEDNLKDFSSQKVIIDTKVEKLQELSELRQRASDVFNVHLTYPDIIVAAGSGVILGIANALFKDFIPKNGFLDHVHDTTRTAVDYGIPKPPTFSGSVNNLHRQLGPGHDIFRFKQALDLLAGNTSDFSLWGETATSILHHELSPVNLRLTDFRQLGGFNIPDNPAAELLHHLLIDFFTKRSLPLPGSSYLADSSPEMAKLMLNMYDKDFNLKVILGNFIGYGLIQIIIHGYTFLFKAVPQSQFNLNHIDVDSLKMLLSTYWKLIHNNEFHVMMMMSHGASFVFDSVITLAGN